MFNVKHNECVGFESRWEVKKVCSETSTQTTDFSTTEKGSNTSAQSSSGMQTIAEKKPAQTKKTDEAEMEKLAVWLKKLYPNVTKELDNINSTSRFFKSYHKLLNNENQEANCKLLQNVDVSFPSEGGEQATKVGFLCWNQTGNSLAVSCSFEHAAWCHHSGLILIYALNSNDRITTPARKKLKTQSCVTALQYHLTNPSIIAAGTFSGSIYIWNTQSDENDSLILSKNVHGEYITQISWVYDLDTAKTVLLATSSTDGLLKLWIFISADNTLRLKARYKIKYPVLGYINGKQVIKSENLATKSSIGVVCFDFSPFIQDLFVVGLEGGLIVQCSVLGTSTLKGHTKDEPLFDPVFKYYEPHEGEITHMKFSPNRKEMFLTSGTDGEIRVYLVGQDEPAQIIFLKEALNDISWVPHEDKLIGGVQKGKLDIFNLKTAKAIENVTDEKVAKDTLCSLAVNSSKINYTAIGDDKGHLQLWSVPWQLFTTETI